MGNSVESLGYIPHHIEPVSQEAIARLHEKQWRARVWMRGNVFASAMNAKLRVHLKRCAKVEQIRC